MASKNIVEIVIKATDQASKKMKGLDGVFKKLGVAAAATGVAVAAMGVAAGVAIIKMTKEAAQVEKLKGTFDALADSINENADLMIKDLRVASRGMLNDADLMQASNKLVAMGLAETSEESSKLVEMSTQLGSAMGMDATEAAEAFALMLANQSIPRLDNFGISSGVVRDRILELMEADKSMTREQAFMNAVMEEGSKTMEKVGEQGTGAAASMARLQAKVDNLKVEIGRRFLPILEVLADKLIVLWDDPKVQEAIGKLFVWIEGVADSIVDIVNYLADGNVEAAFDTAFGEGAYKSVQKVLDIVNNLKFALSDIPAAFARTYQPFAPKMAQQAYMHSRSDVNRTLYSGGRASGGSVSAGGSYLVGERGPEMLTMGSDGYVTPNNKLGGVTVHLHMNSAVSLADRAEAERVLVPFIEKGLRTVMAR